MRKLKKVLRWFYRMNFQEHFKSPFNSTFKLFFAFPLSFLPTFVPIKMCWMNSVFFLKATINNLFNFWLMDEKLKQLIKYIFVSHKVEVFPSFLAQLLKIKCQILVVDMTIDVNIKVYWLFLFASVSWEPFFELGCN